uniref:Uncharacterized protein n=1 Tax=Oryza punctata TaxID=4537 RepID=A0A0E0KNU1_ORYPU
MSSLSRTGRAKLHLEKHVPSESFWPYLNITAQQEQLFKQDSLQSSLFVAFKMVWLTSKYETSVRIKS